MLTIEQRSEERICQWKETKLFLIRKRKPESPKRAYPYLIGSFLILFVDDLDAERNFYVRLGFTVSYQGPEFP